jgi:hypothetical protein
LGDGWRGAELDWARASEAENTVRNSRRQRDLMSPLLDY